MALSGFKISYLVLGPRDPADLGVVLPHEQPLVDLRKRSIEPRPGFLKYVGDISELEFRIENLGKIRLYP